MLVESENPLTQGEITRPGIHLLPPLALSRDAGLRKSDPFHME